MLTGPKGEKRPADVVGCAVHVMRIVTGEIRNAVSETVRQPARAKGGRAGGTARAAALAPDCRIEIDRQGAAAYWKRYDLSMETRTGFEPA